MQGNNVKVRNKISSLMDVIRCLRRGGFAYYMGTQVLLGDPEGLRLATGNIDNALLINESSLDVSHWNIETPPPNTMEGFTFCNREEATQVSGYSHEEGWSAWWVLKDKDSGNESSLPGNAVHVSYAYAKPKEVRINQ